MEVRRFAHKYPPEEVEYMRKRIVSYLESGFCISKAIKPFGISKETYKKLFGDCELIKATIQETKKKRIYGKL